MIMEVKQDGPIRLLRSMYGPPMSERRVSKAANEAMMLTMHMAERLLERYTAHAAEFGLSPPHVKTLLALDDSGHATSMRAVAERIHFDPSNLTAIVDRLEARGLLARRGSAEDRRVKALVITPAGEKLRTEFKRRLAGDPGPMGGLSEDEIRTYRDILRRALPDVDL
jgi:DNA-binding MarR family transcriptional regulator